MIGGSKLNKGPARPAAPEGPTRAFLSDEATRSVVEGVLSELSGATPVIELGGIAAAQKRLGADAAAALIIVDISGAEDGAAAVADLMSVIDPTTKVIVIGETNDVTLFRSLLTVGIADYLVRPVEKRTLRSAVNAALKPPGTGETGGKQGKVVAFFGTRGGTGATTIAVNTAALVAGEFGARVAMVDLDLHFGTVALAFGLEPAGGLREALERPDRVDTLFIERAMTKYSDKLYVLGAEEPLSQSVAFDPQSLRALLSALQASFEVVIVDVPRGAGPMQRHVLTVADHVVVVSELSLAGVRDCLRIKTMLKDSDANARPIYVASELSGHKRAPVSPTDFKDTVGERLAVVLPLDEKALVQASAANKPVAEVAKASPFVKALRTLASELAGKKVATAQQPIWRRLFHKQQALKPAKA